MDSPLVHVLHETAVDGKGDDDGEGRVAGDGSPGEVAVYKAEGLGEVLRCFDCFASGSVEERTIGCSHAEETMKDY